MAGSWLSAGGTPGLAWALVCALIPRLTKVNPSSDRGTGQAAARESPRNTRSAA